MRGSRLTPAVPLLRELGLLSVAVHAHLAAVKTRQRALCHAHAQETCIATVPRAQLNRVLDGTGLEVLHGSLDVTQPRPSLNALGSTLSIRQASSWVCLLGVAARK